VNDTLFLIPARGGSKGLPRKNILSLAGKPLIQFSIEAARGVVGDEHICVSTDDPGIISVVRDQGLEVPFIRPHDLATDTSGSREVILHALMFYEEQGKSYGRICLLQPTSPLRTSKHIKEAFELWEDGLDMVVSVKNSKSNPYFNLFEEEDGFLWPSKKGNFTRRQDAPDIWEYNGAIYLISSTRIKQNRFSDFCKIRKYEMDASVSTDIDSQADFDLVEKTINSRIN
jgi:CMP-N,N'-diacetyllegionaminic acid synthase